MRTPIRIGILGAGNRGSMFARYAQEHPDSMRICVLAEPHDFRRNQLADLHGIPEELRFRDLGSMLDKRPDVDGIINATMDSLHYRTSMDILEAGYPMLLEKPICLNREELFDIDRLSKEKNLTVMVCHVLRYAPFYTRIKQLLDEGEIGLVYSIRTEENVSYHHLAAAFIRGKWNNSHICGSPMLMSKCCHDLDILTFLKGKTPPKYVSSMGNRFQFREENAPEGSGTACMVDCAIEESCLYSSKKLYIENDTWECYAGEFLHGHPDQKTTRRKVWGMQNGNPLGRCMWRCDNNIVDHQSVTVEFSDGCIATHLLTGGTAKPCRTIHIIGTGGEISGVMEEGRLAVRTPDLSRRKLYSERTINLSFSKDGHGGGDERLAADFVRILSGEKPILSSATLEESMYGHLIGFAAHEAMTCRRVVEIGELT